MFADHPDSALITDFYELTMAHSYWQHDMHAQSTFSLYLRENPERGYYVAAGLEPALDFLERFRFQAGDIEFLAQTGKFDHAFLDYLGSLRFTGEVRALAEGSAFFPGEPVMEVTAPVIEAQLLETFLINTVGLHTLLATKAARCVYAAQGRSLVDFGLRRTQGVDAGMALARSSYIAGFDATSNVLAAKQFDIPAAGTMAHSFIQAFGDEKEAFEAYARTYPRSTILLIDTYDTLQGARHAVQVARKMAAAGNDLVGVRLDSGDMCALSQQVRRILDDAGMQKVKIFASGGFDEHAVARALEKGAAIDAFGVGTKTGVSADLPYLDMVYKLVRYDSRDVHKLSPGKQTLAGEKQVFRRADAKGDYVEDIIGVKAEVIAGASPLLHAVMREGRVVGHLPALDEIRRGFAGRFQKLPDVYKHLSRPARYQVRLSPTLEALQEDLKGGRHA